MWIRFQRNREAIDGSTELTPRIMQVFFSLAKLSLVALVLGFAGMLGGRWFVARSEEYGGNRIPNVNVEENTIERNDTDASPRVLGENDSLGGLLSENYRIGRIVLGGDVNILSQGDDLSPLAIENIRGEALGSRNQNEGRALITWKTSKAANSTLHFEKTVGGSDKVIEEDGFGMTHSAVLSGLDLASTYLYTISVHDRYGGELKSDPHVVYTGSREVSLFELIVNALQDVFGWAVKR